MSAAQRHKPPLASLVAIGAARLAQAYPDGGQAKARRVMGEVATDLCQKLGGKRLHVPKAAAARLQQRDADIRQQFATDGPGQVRQLTAARLAQVADEFGLSVRRVRSIVAAVNPAAKN